MSETVSYQYNYDPSSFYFTLTADQLSDLKAILAGVKSSDLTQSGQGLPIYNYLLGLITGTGGNPVSGVDPNVFAWISGASGVNAGTSSPGQWIRLYTSAVYQILYGAAPTDAQLNMASNEIAIGLASNIISQPNPGLLPSIEGLGVIDAGAAASDLFSGAFAPWAGVILFPTLNVNDFYTTWLLNTATVSGTITENGSSVTEQFKPVSGTYNIISDLEAFDKTVEQHPVLSSEANSGSKYGATGNSASLEGATQAFFLQVYGLTSGQVPGIGTGTPFDSPNPLTEAADILGAPVYIAGTLSGATASDPLVVDDQLTYPVSDVVNAGPGNDTILILDSNGLIDGGGGYNVADYSQWLGQPALSITLEVPTTGSFSYRFLLGAASTVFLPDSYTDYLYEFQKFIGDSGGDTLDITPLSAANWNAIGQTLTVDLGSSDANHLKLDGNTSLGRNTFSVAPGISTNDVIVSAVLGSVNLGTTIYGVDVVNPGTIVITPGVLGDAILLQDPSNYDVLIDGFPVGTTIDLEGISANSGMLNALGIFTIQKTDGSSLILNLDPIQNYSGESFLFAPDGAGGTDIIAEADSQPIAFTGGAESLLVDSPGSLSGTISNFQPGDTIDLAGVVATSATLGADNLLGVIGSFGTLPLQLDPSQNFVGFNVDPIPDGDGGTNIVLNSLVGLGVLGTPSLVDPATGKVTALGARNGELVISQVGAQAALNGKLYEIALGGILFTLNIETGLFVNSVHTTAITGLANLVADNLTGKLVGVENSEVVTVDPTTGNATAITGTIAGLASVTLGAAAAVNGQFYVLNSNDHLYDISLQTGFVSSVSTTALNFVADNLTGELVGVENSEVEAVNPLTGALTAITTTIPGLKYVQLGGEAAENGYFYAIGYDQHLYTVNIQTGQLLSSVTTPGITSLQNFVADQTSIACFAAGTFIATRDGETLVELLVAGDLVRSAAGELLQVKWLGHRCIDCGKHPKPADVWPVRVRAGSFGEGMPRRDLFLSPDHAVFAGGALIPIKHLVNGASVVQEPRDEVTYWHVELEQHDVLYAEGLPCESYLDTGNRAMFANVDVTVLHPSFGRTADGAWTNDACTPLVEDGPILVAAQKHLATRATEMGLSLPSIPTIDIAAPGATSIMVPPEAEVIHLLSASARQGGDRRRLGALVRGIRIDGAEVTLQDVRLGSGFHEVEVHGIQTVRWTNGAAALHIGRASSSRRIEVDVASVIAANQAALANGPLNLSRA